jgi:histidinol-phosphatase (PHP family)
VALSSDAHVPDDLGHRYDQAVELLRSLGVEEIAVFERRRRRMEALG